MGIKRMKKIEFSTYRVVLMSLCVVLTACSSEDDSDVMQTDTQQQPPADSQLVPDDDPGVQSVDQDDTSQLDYRIVAIDTDIGSDGEIEKRLEWSYDERGRVTMAVEQNLVGSSDTQMVTFTYNGDDLVMQTTPWETINYTVQNGLTVAIETQNIYSNKRFRYNPEGLLIEVTGRAFFFDDDCNISLEPTGADPEYNLPEYQLGYDSNGRFTSAVGSYGDVLTITYRQDGQVNRIETSGECSLMGNSFFEYTYDESSLPTGYTLFTEQVSGDYLPVAEYDIYYNNQKLPGQIVQTFIDDGEEFNVVQDLSYNSDGLITQIQITADIVVQGLPREFISTTSFTYEAESCQEQISTDPSEILALVRFPGREFDKGQTCGFILDVNEAF